MKWIQIPDQLQLEANGFSWQEGEDDAVKKNRHFHLRYAYNYDNQSLCVDIIEDRPDDTPRIIMPKGSHTGIHEDKDTFHHAVAAIECTFPSSAVIKSRKLSHLANLIDLYRDSYEEFTNLGLEQKQEAIQQGFSLLFKTYEYAKKQDQGDPTLSGEFTNVVCVDFKSREKAYKPEDDLLEQMRGAIGRMKNHDSPVTKIFGPANGPS